MASAAGMPCDIDPALCAALRSQKTEIGEDDYNIACLLMVFVAVAIPKLARSEMSVYKAELEGIVFYECPCAHIFNCVSVFFCKIQMNNYRFESI